VAVNHRPAIARHATRGYFEMLDTTIDGLIVGQLRAYGVDGVAVDARSSGGVAQRIAGVATPTNGTDAANKAYVDAVKQGLYPKDPARVASTANVTIASPGTAIDGVTLAVGDRVLLKNQTAAQENGLWIFQGSLLMMTRADDAGTGQLRSGVLVPVLEGTTNGNTMWWITAPDTAITVGTTAITWSQFKSAGDLVAGRALSITGNTIDVLTGAGISASGAIAVSFGGTGSASTVARSDHDHASAYRAIGWVPAWSEVTSKPTTIAGFGITDAYTKTEADGRYRPIGYVPAWSEVTSKPTTLAGYGITDAAPKSHCDVTSGNPHGTTFAALASKPTTIATFGITDAYTKTEADGRYLAATANAAGVAAGFKIGANATNSGTVRADTLNELCAGEVKPTAVGYTRLHNHPALLVYVGQAGEAIAANDPVHTDASGWARRSRADDPTKARVVGVATNGFAQGADVFAAVSGFLEGAASPDAELFLGEAGGLVNSWPTSGRVIRVAMGCLDGAVVQIADFGE
jgi:hypothetical protein